MDWSTSTGQAVVIDIKGEVTLTSSQLLPGSSDPSAQMS